MQCILMIIALHVMVSIYIGSVDWVKYHGSLGHSKLMICFLDI